MQYKYLYFFLLCFCLSLSSVRSQELKFPKNIYNYTFKDTAEIVHKLSEFKDKYIYIDIWASWCHPCINEFPHLDSLKQKLKEKDDLIFIQLSCDTQKWRWINGLGWNKRDGYQYIIDKESSFMKDFQVASIPRYLLIDKNGKLLDGNMTRASDPNTLRRLIELH